MLPYNRQSITSVQAWKTFLDSKGWTEKWQDLYLNSESKSHGITYTLVDKHTNPIRTWKNNKITGKEICFVTTTQKHITAEEKDRIRRKFLTQMQTMRTPQDVEVIGSVVDEELTFLDIKLKKVSPTEMEF